MRAVGPIHGPQPILLHMPPLIRCAQRSTPAPSNTGAPSPHPSVSAPARQSSVKTIHPNSSGSSRKQVEYAGEFARFRPFRFAATARNANGPVEPDARFRDKRSVLFRAWCSAEKQNAEQQNVVRVFKPSDRYGPSARLAVSSAKAEPCRASSLNSQHSTFLAHLLSKSLSQKDPPGPIR